MRRLILLLPLSLSPVYAIGFWGSLDWGLNFGGFGEMRGKGELFEDTVTFKIGASAKDFIAGGNLMGGVSLQPIPIAIGLGVDYYAGTQKYEFDAWSIVVEDTLEVKRTYIKLPVAYQLSLPMLKGYFGIYPAYALYSVKGKGEPDSTSYWMKGRGELDSESIVFKGLAFGFFTNLYYSIGPVGIGGGVFVDYGPRFKGSVTHINNVLYLGINLGLLVSLGVLE